MLNKRAATTTAALIFTNNTKNMIHTRGAQYLLNTPAGHIAGTFQGYKESPSGLLLRFAIPGGEQIFTKYDIIKKI
ncbi:MAG: hypothetical protein EBR82_38275 [Caulobacteraceae bacterium]|nr:hypothetical protein [Caulobacteraceae bacterium]